jgi:hypothetical protein
MNQGMPIKWWTDRERETDRQREGKRKLHWEPIIQGPKPRASKVPTRLNK